MASSVHGIFRATLDVDLVADIQPRHVRLLVTMLQAEYYIDAEMILEAIRRQASCNLIHLEIDAGCQSVLCQKAQTEVGRGCRPQPVTNW